MTYTEIIEKLKTIFEDVGEFAHEALQYDFENYPDEIISKMKDRFEIVL